MQFLDITGLNYYTSKLKDGTLKVGASSAADSVPASGITGVIDLSHIPAAAIERLTVVADDTARLALTSSDVQLGDTVKVTATGKMYFVKDVESLGTEAAFEEYTVGTAAQATYATTAGSANAVDWANVNNKPSEYAPSAHTHSSAEVVSMGSYAKAASASAIATTDTLNQAIGKLEKGIEEASADASTAITNAINALDATKSQTAGTDGLSLSITEVDGLIDSISGSIAANTYEPYGAASAAINALDVTKSQTAGTDGLALSITQTDGLIASISGSIAANTYDAYGAASTAKSEVIGASGDAKSANTIYGAKAYADDAVSTAVANIVAISTSNIDAIIAGTYTA